MKILDGNDFLMSNQEQLTATIGMFDGMHRGHITLINALKHEAMARHQRSAVITFRKHPQLVVNPGDSPAKDFIELLHDHYNVATLVMGYNHRFGHERNTTFAHYVEQGRLAGVEVVKAPEYLGRYAPVSSSIVRQLITSGRVEDAMNCMGHPFELSGKVVHGFHNGRGIGFPTANVGEIDPAMILPHQGAYAVMVYVSGQWHKGMVNIGHRPTLDNGDNVSIEVHIFDFDDDIYSQPITLHFVRFLRLEFKLGSIEQLRAQLTYDKQLSNQILDNYISQQSTIE